MIISLSDVYAYHDYAIEKYGGDYGIRDNGLIESAYNSIFQGFGDTEFYPTIEEKAARLGFGIAINHGFLDGNKRTGCLLMNAMLELNGLTLDCSNDELYKLFYGIADSQKVTYEKLLSFVLSHVKEK